jgi:hypothetical protein
MRRDLLGRRVSLPERPRDARMTGSDPDLAQPRQHRRAQQRVPEAQPRPRGEQLDALQRLCRACRDLQRDLSERCHLRQRGVSA